MNWNKFLPCILFGSLLGACSGKGEQPKVEPTTLCLTDSLLRIVSVDTVHVCEVVDELTLNGRVTFNQDQVANVYPMFGGTVTELRAEIGDLVRKGEVLAVIRSGEVADYEKQLKEAEQQLLLARRNMDATQDMYTSGMASDKDVLQAKQELATAEAEERRIKEIFSIYHFSGNAFYQLKSPVSGFIVEKQISRDMQLRPDQGDALFTISGLSDVWVMADVYESDISKVSEGADVRISTLAYPERTFTGTIDKAYHLLDSESKTMNVRIKLKNEDYLLIGKSILIESLPLAFMTGERLGDVFRCFFTRQLPINDPGNAGSGLFIGMHMIGKTLFHTCQRSMQIDYSQSIFSSQLIDNRHHAVYNRTVINPPLYSIGGNRVTQVDFRF